jgi:hypothetical protein
MEAKCKYCSQNRCSNCGCCPHCKEWISVKERNPADDDEFLVIMPAIRMLTHEIDNTGKSRWFDDDLIEYKKVTHWMPLPEKFDGMD